MKILLSASLIFLSLVIGSALSADPVEYLPQVTFIGEGLGGEAFTGNFDEDQWPDLILMEPGYNDLAGRIHVYLNTNDLAAGQYNMDLFLGDITIAGEPHDQVGQKGAVCDFNGDSYTDIIINRTYWGGALGADFRVLWRWILATRFGDHRSGRRCGCCHHPQ